jgi:hypothetical protein
VFAPCAGWLEQAERQGIAGRDNEDAVRMRPIGQFVDFFQHTEKIGVLDHQGRDVLAGMAL